MTKINITKNWLNEIAERISSIYVPNHGKGFVRWVKDEQVDYMIEQDDGSFKYYIITFDEIIKQKDDIVVFLEESYYHSDK